MDRVKHLTAENHRLEETTKTDSVDTLRRLADMQKQLEEYRREKDYLTKEIDTLNHSHEQSLKQHAATLTRELDKVRLLTQKQTERCQSMESNYKKAMADLSESRSKAQSLETLHAKLLADLKADATEAGNLKSKIADLENVLSDKDIRIKSLSLDNRNLQTDVERLKRDLGKASEKLEAINPMLALQKEDIRRLNAELSAANEEVEKARRQLDVSAKDSRKLADKIDRQKATILAKDEEIASLKATNKDLTGQLRDAGRKHSVSKVDSEAFSKRVVEQDSILSKLKDQNSQLREADMHLKRKLENSRVKIEELERQLQASAEDWKTRLKQKDKIIRDLSNQSTSLKTEWASDIRKKDVQTSEDIDDVRRRYDIVVQDLRDSIIQDKEDHAQEIQGLRDEHMSELKKAASRYAEDIKLLKQEFEIENSRLSNQIEVAVNKIAVSAESSDVRAQLHELYQIKLDQAKADIEAKCQEDTDQLLNDKIELKAEIVRVNNEITRLREMYENLKTHQKSDYVTPSASNSRAGSFSSVRRETPTNFVAGRDRSKAKAGPQRRKSGLAGRMEQASDAWAMNDQQSDDHSFTANQDDSYKIEYVGGQTGARGDQLMVKEQTSIKQTKSGTRGNKVYGNDTGRSDKPADKRHQQLMIDEYSIENSESNGRHLDGGMMQMKPNSDRSYQKSTSYSPMIQGLARQPAGQMAIQGSDKNSKGDHWRTGDFGQSHLAQGQSFTSQQPRGYDFTFKKPSSPSGAVQTLAQEGDDLFPSLRLMHQYDDIRHQSALHRFESPGYLKTLTSLRKARILNNALQHVTANMKRRAFNAVVACRIKRLRAWGEAGCRVKGRLLMVLKSRYADVPVRRSFLKWAMLANKDFVRNCITKIAITSKLNEESVFWRFRKGIEKRMQNRIPASAKAARTNLGSHILHYLFKIVRKSRKIEVFNKIRPKILGKENSALNRVLSKSVVKSSVTALAAFRQLRSFGMRRSMALTRLLSALQSKQIGVIRCLRSLNISQKEGQTSAMAANELQMIAKAMRRAVSSNIEKIVGVDRVDRLQSVTNSMMARMNHSKAILERLAIHRLLAHKDEIKHRTAKREKACLRLMNISADKSRDREADAYHKLIRHAADASLHAIIEQRESKYLDEKVAMIGRRMANRLATSSAVKSRISFDSLLRHSRQQAAERDRKLAMQTREGLLKSKLVKKLVVAQRLKTNAACAGLLQFCSRRGNFEKLKMNKLSALLSKLINSCQAKSQVALLDLKQWNFEEQLLEENRRNTAMELDHLKTSLLSRLLFSSTSKIRQSLDRCRALNTEASLKTSNLRQQQQRFLNRLSSVWSIKHHISLSILRKSSVDRSIYDINRRLMHVDHMMIVDRSMRRLIDVANANRRSCMMKMIDASRSMRERQRLINDGRSKWLMVLATKLNDKKRLCFARLVNFRLQVRSHVVEGSLMAATASKTKHHLMSRLVRSLTEKVAGALNNLKTHCGGAILAEDSQSKLKKLMLARLKSNIQGEISQAYQTLREWNRQKNEEELSILNLMRIQDKLKHWLVTRLVTAHTEKTRQCLTNLQRTTILVEKALDRRSRCLKTLLHYLELWSASRKSAALGVLRRQMTASAGQSAVRKAHADIRLKARHTIVLGILKAAVTKQRLTFNQLTLHSGIARLKSAAVKRNVEIALIRLIAASIGKLRESTGRLRHNCDMNRSFMSAKAWRCESKAKRVIDKILADRVSGLRRALETLRKYGAREKERDRLKAKALGTLKAAQNMKMQESLRTLQSFNYMAISETRLSESIMENIAQQEMAMTKRLCKKLVYGLKNKVAMTFRVLSYHNAEQSELKVKEARMFSMLQGQLDKSSLINKKTILGRLRLNARLDKEYRDYIYRICSTIMKRLVTSRRSKLQQAFNELFSKTAENTKMSAASHRLKSALLSRLSSATSVKAMESLNRLKSHQRWSDSRSMKVSAKLMTLTNVFDRSEHTAKRQAIQSVNRWSQVKAQGYLTAKSVMQSMANGLMNRHKSAIVGQWSAFGSQMVSRRQSLSSLMTRLASASLAKVRQSTTKLVLHQMASVLVRMKRVTLLTGVVRSIRRSAESSFDRLRLHRLLERHLGIVRRIKLGTVVSRAQSDLFKESFRKLVKNWRDKERLYRLLAKYAQRSKMQAAYSAFGRWNMIRGYENKRLVDHRILRVFNQLEKNRRIAMRMAFDKWKLKLKKERVVYKKVSTILETLLRKSKQHAFDKVYHKSQIEVLDIKTRSMRSLLMMMHDVVTKRKRHVFQECKTMYHTDNKWFKRVVYIWTQKSKLNQQKAFWRIKDEKILGLSSVETSKAVKLRTLVNLLSQKEKEKKASAFSSISYSTIFKSWQHSMSLSPTKKPTAADQSHSQRAGADGQSAGGLAVSYMMKSHEPSTIFRPSAFDDQFN